MKKIGTVAGASVAAFAVGATLAGGVAIATAKDSNKNSTGAQQSFERGRGHGHGAPPPPGEMVTGADAQQAIDAATAVVPGTADHVFKTSEGNYLVMVETADDKHIVVTLDSNFTVTGQQEMTGPPHGGPGGPHGTPASAEETQKVTDAVLADQPGATVQAVDKEEDGTFEAHFTTSDGVRKEAHLDANYAITSIEDDHGPGPGGPHGTPASTEETQKVTDAITAEVPGAKVAFVEKLPDGTFEAHFMTAGGVRKEAHLDADYKITSIHKDRGPKGGPRGQDVQGKAYRKAKAAAKAEVKGTVMDVHKDGKKYFAMVRKSNGSGVIVKMNSDFDVTGTQKIKVFMHHGGPNPSATAPSTAPSAA